MPRSALRLAGLCVLSVAPAEAAFGPEPARTDEQALFQLGIQVEPPLDHDLRRPGTGTKKDMLERIKDSAIAQGTGNEADIVERVGAYASSPEGDHFVADFNKAFRTVAVSARKLKVLMGFALASGNVDTRTARVAIDSMSLNMSDFPRISGRTNRRTTRMFSDSGAKEEAPTDSDDLHSIVSNFQGFFDAARSDKFMMLLDQNMYQTRSLVLTETETVDFVVNSLVSDLENASSPVAIWLMTEAFNVLGDRYTEDAKHMANSLRTLFEGAPNRTKTVFQPLLSAVTSASALLNAGFIRNYLWIPGNLTESAFCTVMDPPIALFRQIRPAIAAFAAEGCASLKATFPTLRGLLDSVDPAYSSRVMYWIESAIGAFEYMMVHAGLQLDGIAKVEPFLKKPLSCKLPQLTAASAQSLAVPMRAPVASPRSSDSERVAGLGWGFWPWAALSFVLASFLSQ